MNRTSELIDAIIAGDTKRTSNLITNGANISETDDCGRTPLHIAVENQNVDAVELLLNQDGINVNAAQPDGFTPLILASTIKQCNLKIIQMLLQHHGSSINKTDFINGRSALHFAVEICSLEIIKLLIESGAAINAQDVKQETSLHIAMKRRDNVEIVAMLLYYNVDTSISNVFGPPIQEAKTAEIRELLLPHTDLCNEDVLTGLDIVTFKLLWQNYQSKAVFAQWLSEDIQTRMRYLFGIFNLSRREFSSFLHELYEDEEMQQVMYHKETTTCLLELVPFNTGRSVPEKVTADMLRLLLCNYNVIGSRALEALQQKIEFAPLIIRVFEDLDVIVEEHVNKQPFGRVARPTPWPLLWGMFCTPRIDLEMQLLQYADHKVVKQFYAVGRTASLVELCRNKIRDTVFVQKCSRKQPFHNATVLNSLDVPRVLLDVLLLRKPVYCN